jgi:hypothetical protein
MELLNHLIEDGQLHRRLDDYYSYDNEAPRQHPWYSHIMLLILALLLIVSIGYGLYQVYYSAKTCADKHHDNDVRSVPYADQVELADQNYVQMSSRHHHHLHVRDAVVA